MMKLRLRSIVLQNLYQKSNSNSQKTIGEVLVCGEYTSADLRLIYEALADLEAANAFVEFLGPYLSDQVLYDVCHQLAEIEKRIAEREGKFYCKEGHPLAKVFLQYELRRHQAKQQNYGEELGQEILPDVFLSHMKTYVLPCFEGQEEATLQKCINAKVSFNFVDYPLFDQLRVETKRLSQENKDLRKKAVLNLVLDDDVRVFKKKVEVYSKESEEKKRILQACSQLPYYQQIKNFNRESSDLRNSLSSEPSETQGAFYQHLSQLKQQKDNSEVLQRLDAEAGQKLSALMVRIDEMNDLTQHRSIQIEYAGNRVELENKKKEDFVGQFYQFYRDVEEQLLNLYPEPQDKTKAPYLIAIEHLTKLTETINNKIKNDAVISIEKDVKPISQQLERAWQTAKPTSSLRGLVYGLIGVVVGFVTGFAVGCVMTLGIGAIPAGVVAALVFGIGGAGLGLFCDRKEPNISCQYQAANEVFENINKLTRK